MTLKWGNFQHPASLFQPIKHNFIIETLLH